MLSCLLLLGRMRKVRSRELVSIHRLDSIRSGKRYTPRFTRPLTWSALAAIALAVFAGQAAAGTINYYCDCTPTTIKYVSNEPVHYCECDNSDAFSALATHQFDRHCSAPDSNGWSLRKTGVDAPITQMRNIPSNMTCTSAAARGTVPEYYYNQCTNWNFSKKSATVITWCARCGDVTVENC